MQTIQFRQATFDELAEIVRMLADDALGSGREDASLPLDQRYRDAFRAIAADPNQLLAVMEVDGAIAGCLQLSFIPGLSRLGAWRGQVESVRIHSDFRGRGLGREMLEWAIEQCRERGCRLVQLTADKTRTEARSFYESLGFKATHEGMKIEI